MRCVYLLQSIGHPQRRYVGSTNDLKRRLAEHNTAQSQHTAKYAPWKVVVALWFEDAARAESFERYLKQGSGYAFANRHFWGDVPTDAARSRHDGEDFA